MPNGHVAVPATRNAGDADIRLRVSELQTLILYNRISANAGGTSAPRWSWVELTEREADRIVTEGRA
jgi:hypothetical protein